MKKISIIVPCYNVENYIDRCVEALVGQTIGVEALELIFVDDASTDETWAKLCQWESKYPDSVMLIHSEENRKQGGARNLGLSYASADYIGFVDADDWIELSMYEKMYGKAVETGVDVVAVLYQREDIDGKIYREKMVYAGQTDKIYTEDEKDWPSLPGGVWSKLYRRDIILDNEVFFPEGLRYEDNYWGVLLSFYIHSFYVIGEVLYHYFVNDSSTIMQKDAMYHMDRLVVEKLKLEELRRRGFYEKDRDRLDFQFLRYYYINTLHIFFTRFTEQPYETICEMQREVCRQVPDFEQNPYLHKLNWVEQFFLKTARMKLSREEIEEIAAGYLSDLELVNKGAL